MKKWEIWSCIWLKARLGRQSCYLAGINHNSVKLSFENLVSHARTSFVCGRGLRPRAIIRRVIGSTCAIRIWSSAQNWEAAHQCVVDGHERAWIVKLTAVVGCAEDCHQLSSAEKLVTIFNHLMGSADKINIIFLEELLDNCLSKRVRYATIILAPTWLAFLGVRP